MFKKKAQAAMEFLMTYGWAILIVLAVIATLTSFGVLNTDIFVPAKCVIGSVGNINCINYKLNTTGHLYFKIENGGGKGDLKLTSIKLEKGDLGDASCGGDFRETVDADDAKKLAFAGHETVSFYVGNDTRSGSISDSSPEQAVIVSEVGKVKNADGDYVETHTTLVCKALAGKPEGRKMKAEIRLGYVTANDPDIEHVFSGSLVLPVEDS